MARLKSYLKPDVFNHRQNYIISKTFLLNYIHALHSIHIGVPTVRDFRLLAAMVALVPAVTHPGQTARKKKRKSELYRHHLFDKTSTEAADKRKICSCKRSAATTKNQKKRHKNMANALEKKQQHNTQQPLDDRLSCSDSGPLCAVKWFENSWK